MKSIMAPQIVDVLIKQCEVIPFDLMWVLKDTK